MRGIDRSFLGPVAIRVGYVRLPSALDELCSKHHAMVGRCQHTHSLTRSLVVPAQRRIPVGTASVASAACQRAIVRVSHALGILWPNITMCGRETVTLGWQKPMISGAGAFEIPMYRVCTPITVFSVISTVVHAQLSYEQFTRHDAVSLAFAGTGNWRTNHEEAWHRGAYRRHADRSRYSVSIQKLSFARLHFVPRAMFR